jgi:hypothetical protein
MLAFRPNTKNFKVYSTDSSPCSELSFIFLKVTLNNDYDREQLLPNKATIKLSEWGQQKTVMLAFRPNA